MFKCHISLHQSLISSPVTVRIFSTSPYNVTGFPGFVKLAVARFWVEVLKIPTYNFTEIFYWPKQATGLASI